MKRALAALVALCAVGLAVVMVLGGPRTVARRLRDAVRGSDTATLDVARVDPTATAPFTYSVIDATSAGDVKMVGDIDGDGQLDLVVGGSTDPSEGLRWYRYPDWSRTNIASAQQEFTTDGELGDVDGDGDQDIVIGDGDHGENLMWFENPSSTTPSEDGEREWTRHAVAELGGFVKDVELADFDGDGRLDIATREPTAVTVLFQDPGGWTPTVPDIATGEEGMASGDIDGDGDVDLVLQGVWAESAGTRDARDGSNWPVHEIGTADPAFKAIVGDVNGDGHAEVVYSSSEHTADVVMWFPPAAGPASGQWRSHVVIPQVERAHTLQAGDMDGDGDVDLVVAQMHTSADQRVMVVENLDGRFETSAVRNVGSGGIHDGVVADIGGDGDLDLIGANWTGNPPVELWENHQRDPLPAGDWLYGEVTDQHQQTFGMAFTDVDGDGGLDIVSGGFWYRNPGGDLGAAPWVQGALPDGMHAIASLDVDRDARADVIAQRDDGDDLGVYWLEAPESERGSWSTVAVGSVPSASHELGAQGVQIARLVPDGPEDVLVSSGGGIFSFEVPSRDAEQGAWARGQISDRPSDEGFAVIDIDGDGRLDVVATTGDSKHVEWYRAPDWDVQQIGDFTAAEFPDRVGAGDLNGDGRVDVVVTAENGQDSGAPTVWWEQPADPDATWPAHELTVQGTTNSLDLTDMDGDGDLDVVLAEHRGQKRLQVWNNDGTGSFTETVVATGYENHLGARAVDIDGDGDLDLVGIGFDHPETIHVWRRE